LIIVCILDFAVNQAGFIASFRVHVNIASPSSSSSSSPILTKAGNSLFRHVLNKYNGNLGQLNVDRRFIDALYATIAVFLKQLSIYRHTNSDARIYNDLMETTA